LACHWVFILGYGINWLVLLTKTAGFIEKAKQQPRFSIDFTEQRHVEVENFFAGLYQWKILIV